MYMLSLSYRPRNPLWVNAASAMTMAGGKGTVLFPCSATGNQADDATLDRNVELHPGPVPAGLPAVVWPGALSGAGSLGYRVLSLAGSDQGGISKEGVEAGTGEKKPRSPNYVLILLIIFQ